VPQDKIKRFPTRAFNKNPAEWIAGATRRASPEALTDDGDDIAGRADPGQPQSTEPEPTQLLLRTSERTPQQP